MDQYVKGAVLGQGSFGRAILVTRKSDGKKFVVKEIDISRMPRAEREAAQMEVKVLMSLKHPNIVACYESFVDDGKLCIVMEYCSEGDLYNILKKRRGQLLPEETIIDWFVQICLAMKHVHDRKILHRDLKTQNIFVSSSGLLKLGDFGVAKVLGGTQVLASTAVGTPYYLSPEICQNRKYNHKSDIWSLGCVLYEITTLRHAFDANSLQLLIHKIVKGQFPPVSPKYSKPLRDIVNKMIRTNPTERPSVNQLLQEPVLKARIESFLSQSVMAHEFAHTVIHGRPGPGQLVPQFRGGALPPPPPTPPQQTPSQPPSSKPSPGPSRSASPLPDKRAATPEQRRPSGPVAPAAVAAPSPSPSPAPSNVNNANAAWRAQHESELRRLEEERRKIEEERRKLEEARRKKIEEDKRRAMEEERRRKVEEQKKILEEAKKREEAEKRRRQEELEARKAEAKRQEEERKRQEAEEIARRKAEEKERRERERQAERERMEQQRKEWAARQAEAARNRDKANDNLYGDAGVAVFVPRKDPPSVAQSPAVPRSPAPSSGAERRDRTPPRAPAISAPVSARALDPHLDQEVIAAPGARRQSSADPLADERRRIWEEQRAAALANKARFHDAERASSSPHTEALGPSLRDERSKVQLQGPSGGEISAEYRRQAWEEQRAAAERNRRRFIDGEASSAPVSSHQNSPPREPSALRRPSRDAAGDAYLEALRAEQRRIREEAMRNKQKALEADRAHAAAPSPALPPVSPPRSPRNLSAMDEEERLQAELARLNPMERKIRLQEIQNQRREAELKAYQMRNWKEMKAAAERNRNQVLGELGKPSQVHEAIVAQGQAQAEALQGAPPVGRATPSASPKPSPRASPRGDREEEHDASEYGRMLLEMRDVYLTIDAEEDTNFDDDDRAASPYRPRSASPLRAAAPPGGATPPRQRTPSPGPARRSPSPSPLANVGHIPGVTSDSSSLGARIEELRIFLEQKLGLDKFIRAYQRLEALNPEDDEVSAFTDLVGILGRDNIQYLQYIHQLITCEAFFSAGSQ